MIIIEFIYYLNTKNIKKYQTYLYSLGYIWMSDEFNDIDDYNTIIAYLWDDKKITHYLINMNFINTDLDLEIRNTKIKKLL